MGEMQQKCKHTITSHRTEKLDDNKPSSQGDKVHSCHCDHFPPAADNYKSRKQVTFTTFPLTTCSESSALTLLQVYNPVAHFVPLKGLPRGASGLAPSVSSFCVPCLSEGTTSDSFQNPQGKYLRGKHVFVTPEFFRLIINIVSFCFSFFSLLKT